MSARDRVHLLNDANKNDILSDKKMLTPEEFGRRLYRLMVAKGWRQSDLAREADIGRESVSVYINGKHFPKPTNLRKIADAFGVAPEDLLPNIDHDAIQKDLASFEMRVSPGDPGKSWVVLNRLMTTTAAARIAAIVAEDAA